MKTTLGQLLVNEHLPLKLRDHSRVYDKKSVRALFEDLAKEGPDTYREVNQKLHDVAADVATSHGRQASFSLKDFRTPEEVRKIHREIQSTVDGILAGPGNSEDKHHRIVETVSKFIDPVTKANYEAGIKENNPLAIQVLSGSRGNASQFRALRGGDMMVVDHKDRPIPIPILNSFSEGLDPVQYWAGAYGARKGAVSTKFATPKSGYLGKQLSLAAHRLIITEKNCNTQNGITVPASDSDNEGAVLARDAGPYKAGTVLTPHALKALGKQNIVVRSPMTCQASEGLCQHCAGVRERGSFSPIGDNIGIAAAQAISEPIGQGQLSVKHGGGQAGGKSAKSGLDLITQLVSVPSNFTGSAAIAQRDGSVQSITEAPQGGNYITVDGHEHLVPPGYAINVKRGDNVEAGDVMSEGIPNPAAITEHKGIGEGRRYFMDTFRKALSDGGFSAHRRNIELLARGLVNHVRVTDLDGPGDTIPDDVTEYDGLAKNYVPRHGFQTVKPKDAIGLHLEEPVLHYSIGTRITPRVANTLHEQSVPSVKAHADPPSFAPEMTRAMETLAHSDDWMVRMGGLYGVKRSVLKSVHRTGESNLHGTSYIPSLAQGVEFGKDSTGKGY